jgi:hypothetical protein
MQRGVGLADVGRRIGITGASVSRQLSGEHRAHPDLIRVVRLLAGRDAARQIAGFLEQGGAAL